MGDEDEHELVDNPQRAWLVSARTKAAPALNALGTCLDDGQAALTGGAWTGPRATDWSQELDGRVRDLRRGARQVADDLDDEIATKPLQVCRCQLFSLGTSSPFGDVTLAGGPYPSVSPSCSR